jgi:hypothetical protein
MGKYAFIDRIFGTDDEEETEANDAFDEEDDDEEESDNESDEEDDDQPADEDDATLAQLDKDFRMLRARVRGSSDLSELRSIRADQSAAMAGPQTPTFRLRTRDIIEEIDARVTDVRASRGPRGS